MTRAARPFRIAAVQRLVLWCLLVALPIHGLAGTVIQLLGPAHVHEPAAVAPADVMTGWAYFTRIGHGPLPRNQPMGALEQRAHAHSHATLARHHHPGSDDSVVMIDGAAQDEAATGAGSLPGAGLAAQVALLPALPSAVSDEAGPVAWRAMAQRPLSSTDADLPDKPPKA